MPNWYSKEYDWIDSAYEKCANANFFVPKYVLHVGGVSPDGKTAIGVYHDQELFLFDIDRQQVIEHIGKDIGLFQDARWGNNGRLIIGVHDQVIPGKEHAPYIYQMDTRQGKLFDLPDTLEPVGKWINFAGQDSVLLFYSEAKRTEKPRFFRYSLSTHEITPFPIVDAIGSIAAVSHREILWFRFNYISPDFSESVDLRVASVDKPDNVSTYRLPDVLRVGRAQLSRDGNWLSVFMETRLPDDRFLSASTLFGLGIIDLRPGSPYRYKIYAFYPDHTNGHKVCVNSGYLQGSAWSPDNKYVYHEQIRLSDTTVQFVRREVATGKVEVISDFKGRP